MAGRHRHGFAEGRSENWVHRDHDAREPASFLIAVYQGYVMVAKNAQDVSTWKGDQKYRRLPPVASPVK